MGLSGPSRKKQQNLRSSNSPNLNHLDSRLKKRLWMNLLANWDTRNSLSLTQSSLRRHGIRFIRQRRRRRRNPKRKPRKVTRNKQKDDPLETLSSSTRCEQ